MSREIRDIIFTAVAEQDFKLLQQLELEQKQLMSLYLQLPALLSDIRDLDSIAPSGFSKAKRLTYIALAKIIGPINVICKASRSPVIADMSLLAHLLESKKLTDVDVAELNKAVLKAARAGQVDAVSVLIPWCRLGSLDLHEVWEASYVADGQGSDFVFDVMMRTGAVAEILRDAKRGRVLISEGFLRHFNVHVDVYTREDILRKVLKRRKK